MNRPSLKTLVAKLAQRLSSALVLGSMIVFSAQTGVSGFHLGLHAAEKIRASSEHAAISQDAPECVSCPALRAPFTFFNIASPDLVRDFDQTKFVPHSPQEPSLAFALTVTARGPPCLVAA